MKYHTPQEIEMHRWRMAHPHIDKQIAKKVGMSRSMVNLVMWRKRQSFGGVIEAELKRLGCPGWIK